MTIHAIEATFYIDTDDPERACQLLDRTLPDQLYGFPGGQILQVDIARHDALSPARIHELGLDDA